MPETLSQQAARHAQELAVNEGKVTASTDDFKTVDARLELNRTWRNGFGVGVWAEAKLGGGKPQGAAGVAAKWQWK